MIRFIEVLNETEFNSRLERTAIPAFSLGEVWINEQYVVKVREETGYKRMLAEGRLPPDLDANHEFTSITTNNGGITETHVVVGNPTSVVKRLNRQTQTLLKG
tara:strand:+ start:114 stop:422 length:309 start_codon:yes stop_codon:yes gene_type:complete